MILRLLIWIQCRKSRLLQNDVPVRVSKNFFFNAVFAPKFCVNQTKSGNAWLERSNFKFAVALFFGEKTLAVGDEQAHVSGTSHIDAREINFIEDAVAQREPYATAAIQRGANAALGARRPARRNARPSRRGKS